MMTLRALGALLTYPQRDLLEALDEIGAVLAGSKSLGRGERQRLEALIAEMRSADPFELEERYVALFDRGRSTSLHLFEHVHGDSRERGQAMVDLKAVYERAGFRLAADELPDYLPAVLEYLSCRPSEEARDMLGECAHVLRTVGERLVARGSRYAGVFDALLTVARQPALDWTKAGAPPEAEPHVDDEWLDAPAFAPDTECSAPARSAAALVRFVARRPGNDRKE